jgi:hypothetical protein
MCKDMDVRVCKGMDVNRQNRLITACSVVDAPEDNAGWNWLRQWLTDRVGLVYKLAKRCTGAFKLTSGLQIWQVWHAFLFPRQQSATPLACNVAQVAVQLLPYDLL